MNYQGTRKARNWAVAVLLGVGLLLGARLFTGMITPPGGERAQGVETSAILQAELLPPPLVPTPLARREPATVRVELETVEGRGILAEGVEFDFWMYNGTVPGPFIRVRAGDTVELHFKNATSSKYSHSIDLHAVTGPGGGAKATQTNPGDQTAFRWKALNPGLYVYHCATPLIPLHIANGMYGLILVEPEEGLPHVDHEFYIMQGDIYTAGRRGEPGFQNYSVEKLLAEQPDYVVFNGAVGALMGDKTLKAKVGETVRIYFGVGGPNLTSSFHVIGEIFDRVYTEAGIGTPPLRNVQTTLVPAGGAAIVEFQLDVPGLYFIVDHSLSRLVKGAVGVLEVTGPAAPEIFEALQPGAQDTGH